MVMSHGMPFINYFAALCSLVGLLVILGLIRRGLLREKYALLWLFCGFATVAVCLTPGLVEHICRVLDVTVPLNFLLFLSVMFLASVGLMLTVVVSRQTQLLETLAKEVALLKEERTRRS
jgi:hypothetical protein